MFGWRTRTFCLDDQTQVLIFICLSFFVTKKVKKTVSQAWVRQTVDQYKYALSLFIYSDKGGPFGKNFMALNCLCVPMCLH